MNNVKITITEQGRKTKQNSGGLERAILSKSPQLEADFTSFLNVVGNDGYSFYPGTFELKNGDKYINTDSFKSSSLIAVDIDNKKEGYDTLNPYQALERLYEYGLDCNGMYLSFSDPTDPDVDAMAHGLRYRLLFVLDNVVVDADTYNYLLQMMQALFPEADKRNASSIYFGGRKVIHCNPTYQLSTFTLMHGAHAYQARNCTTPQSIRKNLKKQITKVPNGIFEGGSKNALAIDIPIAHAVNEPLRIDGWADQMRKECQLVDGFLNGDRKYWHNELLGLYLSMRLFEGGVKLWRDAIRDNLAIDPRKIDVIAGHINALEERTGERYHESYLSNFAPNDPATQKCNKLSQLVLRRSQKAQLIAGYCPHYLSLKDARYAVKYLFQHALSKWDASVTVLKIATGVGKTFQITICQHLSECIMACRTHKLVQELADELTVNDIEHIVIPPVPDLPESIQKEYDLLLSIGANNYAAGFLRSLLSTDLSKYGVPSDKVHLLHCDIARYFATIDYAVANTLPVLCTHKRIMHTEFPNHSVIIADEDIMETIGEVGSVTIKSLRHAYKILSNSSHPGIAGFIKLLVAFSQDPSTREIEFSVSDILNDKGINLEILQTKDIRDLITKGVTCSLIHLLHAEYLTIEPIQWNDPEGEMKVSFITKNHLPTDKRLIVLSATANESMYEQMFGDVEFFDLSTVKLRGSIRQFSNRGFSRQAFGHQETLEALKRVAEYAGDKPVITYKGDKYQKHFDNCFRHIEDTMGTNELAGHDIVIPATAQKPTSFYRLWASLLGISYTLSDTEFASRVLLRNGHIFTMISFAGKQLQDIHLHFVESYLVQAVGRARLVEHPATVHVFSRYPVPGATQYFMHEMDILRMIEKVFSWNFN